MYIQQAAQLMLSDVGEQKHDVMPLPFPQPGINAYAQPAMEQAGRLEGHMQGGNSMEQQHQSGSGSDFPSNSPEGVLSPGDNSRKYVPCNIAFWAYHLTIRSILCYFQPRRHDVHSMHWSVWCDEVYKTTVCLGGLSTRLPSSKAGSIRLSALLKILANLTVNKQIYNPIVHQQACRP